MSELVLFGEEILLGIFRGRDLDTNALHNFDACLLQCIHFLRVICHQAETIHSEVPQHFDAKCVVSKIGFKSKVVIGLHGVHASVLELIGSQFVDQSNSTAFLQLINQYPVSFPSDGFQGEFQLVAAIATAGFENVTCQALGVNSNQRSVAFSRGSHDESKHFIGMVFGFESEKQPEYAMFRRESGFSKITDDHGVKYITQV
jgi:hypothetical protein